MAQRLRQRGGVAVEAAAWLRRDSAVVATAAAEWLRWWRRRQPSHRWWNSLAHWRDDESVAGRTTMPRHCRPFPCSLVRRRRRGVDDGGSLLCRRRWGADKSASALLCNGGGGEADDRASG